VDTLAEDGGTPGHLVAFWHDWDRRHVEFPSIAAWLAVLVEQRGVDPDAPDEPPLP
jgi:hypothetical protein